MLEMDAELEQYILAHSEPESEVLAELSRATHLNVLRPRMLSGNLQGQFLKMICRMIGARWVLEIWDLHRVCRYFNGCRIGGGGSAAHDRRE